MSTMEIGAAGVRAAGASIAGARWSPGGKECVFPSTVMGRYRFSGEMDQQTGALVLGAGAAIPWTHTRRSGGRPSFSMCATSSRRLLSPSFSRILCT